MDKWKIGTPECGIICGIIGAVIALLVLIFGIGGALFVVVLSAVGYFIGSSKDKAESIRAFVNKRFPPKGE